MNATDASAPPIDALTVTELPAAKRAEVLRRWIAITLISFLTLTDLFGTQALLPALVDAYGVSPAAMGVAVNASTIGMAIAGLLVAAFSRRLDRKRGIWLSLAILTVPTALLAVVDDVTLFAALRIAQGLCMATAFTLTLTYLSEECSVTAAGGAMVAYITGNVASNLVGRLVAAGVADSLGLDAAFLAFAGLNVAGAALAYGYIGATSGPRPANHGGNIWAAWGAHLANPRLLAMFAIGFLLLFAFIGTFTYVNFVLAAPPFALPQAMLGIVYVVFLPAMLTTPAAAATVRAIGARWAFALAMLTTLMGLALLLADSLALVLVGLAAVGAGLFFAQATATGVVGRTARHDHAVANGFYLSSYYLGGLAGAFVLGLVFTKAGWTATVGVIALTLVAAIALAGAMRRPTEA